jgi:hypothetical protein
MLTAFSAPRRARTLLVVLSCLAAGVAHGQIRVDFSTADAGAKKSIPYWGLDTNWASADNMKRGLIFMGPANVNVVRVPAMVDKPQDAGLTGDEQTHLQTCKDLAALVGPDAKWELCAPGSDTVNAWFQSGVGTVNVNRWAQALKLNQEFYNHPMWIVEPFNEPDYATWGEGTKQNLSDIMDTLQAMPNFSGSAMAGGSTMSCDVAADWYDALNGRAAVGTTHTLYGTVANYVGFIQHVTATKATPIHPEGHNVVEAIIGAEYGLNGMIWWGTAERARGEFVRASMGTRLGYAEDRTNWTAAAVYRSPTGAVQAFLGSSERVGGTTTYTFHATDREVYYDGHGPQRDYSVTIARNQEKVVNITWGTDVPPVIGGRYVLVNVGSGLCLDVSGASTTNGAALVQTAYTGTTHQQWDVTALSTGGIGDLSYFLVTNASSKLNADLADWAYADDAPVKQYGYPDNSVEHWFFEYAGSGGFYVRSRWSNKCLAVIGTGANAAVVQRTFAGTPEQVWRLQDPNAPSITTQPTGQLVNEGKPLTLTVAASGTNLSYQWRKDGQTVSGATSASYSVTAVTLADAGSYDCVVTNTAGSATSAAVTVTVVQTANRTLPTPPANGTLMNISSRAHVGTGANVLIGGVVIGGGKAQVLVRAIGPGLASLGVNDVLLDPQIEGITLSGSSFAKNDDWGQNANASVITSTAAHLGAFALSASSKDAAMLLTLDPGAYTFVVSGVNGTSGNALLEIYLISDSGLPGYLVNLAARGWAGTDGNVMIAGVVARGDTQVMVRGVGPGIAAMGVDGALAKPGVSVYTAKSVLVDQVSMWSSTYPYTAASTLFGKVGAFPLTSGSADALEVLNLSASDPIRTFMCSGTDGGTGVALLEVYLVNP